MSENENKQAADQAAEELKKAAEQADQAEQIQEEPVEESAAVDAALAEAQAKAAEHYDMYVRAVAELENTRRRCADDVVKAQKFGIEKFAQNLLPVVDSLEKAIEITADTEGPMREGLLTTYRQLVHALEVSGMTCIDPKGQKFDPNTQQAIAMVPADDTLAAGDVANVFQRGWKIHERVLRPAMVSVVQG